MGERDVPPEEERARMAVTACCLAQVGKSYNLNFLDSKTQQPFYCSQLAYRAYLNVGIGLNTGMYLPGLPYTTSIIFSERTLGWLTAPISAKFCLAEFGRLAGELLLHL